MVKTETLLTSLTLIVVELCAQPSIYMGTPKSASKQRKVKSVKSSKTGSQSKRAGLVFPVGRLGSKLRAGRYAKRVGAGAPVYLAAVMEYLTAELLELAGKSAQQAKKKRITPRTITLAVRHDEELSALLKNVTFSAGGVPPNVHKSLLTKKDKRRRRKSKKGSKSKASQEV